MSFSAAVPEVKVTPKIQSKRPGEESSMFCHVVGEPFPKVEWLKNDEPLKEEEPMKYEVIGNGTELQIHDIGYADTGAYMCQAVNIGGVTRDISSLVVQEDPAQGNTTSFYVSILPTLMYYFNYIYISQLYRLCMTFFVAFYSYKLESGFPKKKTIGFFFKFSRTKSRSLKGLGLLVSNLGAKFYFYCY